MQSKIIPPPAPPPLSNISCEQAKLEGEILPPSSQPLLLLHFSPIISHPITLHSADYRARNEHSRRFHSHREEVESVF